MRLLVHLHIYYHDQTEYFVGKLANINGCDWDLYVTMNNLNPVTMSLVRAVKPDAHFVETDNIGYDIWPFISIIKSVNLADYDLVMKLHTKSRSVIKTHGLKLKGFAWRDSLVDAMLLDEAQFRKMLGIFERHKETGLVCSRMLWLETINWTAEDGWMLDDELARIGMAVSDRHFCVGTIFIARAQIFSYLQKDNICEQMFAGKTLSHSKGSMSHVYERILSMSAGIFGYHTECLCSDRLTAFYLFINGLVSPLLRNIFSLDREGYEGKKVLRLLGLKFTLQ